MLHMISHRHYRRPVSATVTDAGRPFGAVLARAMASVWTAETAIWCFKALRRTRASRFESPPLHHKVGANRPKFHIVEKVCARLM